MVERGLEGAIVRDDDNNHWVRDPIKIQKAGVKTTAVRHQKMEISWTGPYSWPKFEVENDLPAIPEHPGIYLQTVEYQNGYLIYAAGLTRRTIPTRFREHTRKYMSGDYNVLDIAAMQRGVRKEIWHGWGWSPSKQAEFEKRKMIIHRRTVSGILRSEDSAQNDSLGLMERGFRDSSLRRLRSE